MPQFNNDDDALTREGALMQELIRSEAWKVFEARVQKIIKEEFESFLMTTEMQEVGYIKGTVRSMRMLLELPKTMIVESRQPARQRG